MKNKNQNKVIVGTWSLSGDFGYVKKNIVYKTLDTAVKNNFLEFKSDEKFNKEFVYSEVIEEKVKSNEEAHKKITFAL